MKMFEYKTPYASYKDCMLSISHYTNEPLCMALNIYNGIDGPITTVTVNLGHDIGNNSIMLWNQAFIDVNNNPNILEWIEENGLAEPVIRFGEQVIACSGFCEYPLYVFNEDKLKEFDESGWAQRKEEWVKHYSEWCEGRKNTYVPF